MHGKRALAPPPRSYASRPESNVAVWHVALQPGGTMELPTEANGTNRALFFVEGEALEIGGESGAAAKRVDGRAIVTLRADAATVLRNPAPTGGVVAEALVLQGRPIGEPVAQHGPFVMNTDAEIEQAFADYQRTRFGGWPWKTDSVTFGDQPRFALFNGKKEEPPPLPEDARD